MQNPYHRFITTFSSESYGKIVRIRLDELDNHRIRFWDKFVAALSCWDEQRARVAKERRLPETLRAFHAFCKEMQSTRLPREPVTLVLWGGHNLSDGPVADFVRWLMLAGFEGITVALVNDDAISFGTPHCHRELDLQDPWLTLSRQEAGLYLTVSGILLEEESFDYLYALTEGRAHLIHHFVHSLKAGEPLSQEDIDGALHPLYQRWNAEIFQACPPAGQKALILLSQLEWFTLELAETATGLSGPELLELTETTVYIRLSAEREIYRFHRLFRLFLRQKRIALNRRVLASFYRAAGAWYAQNGQSRRAVECFAACNAYDEIYDTLLGIGFPYLSKECALYYLEILDRFPDEFVQTNPMTGYIRANMHMHTKQMTACRKELMKLLHELERKPYSDETEADLGEAYILLSFAGMMEARRDFVDSIKKAAALLPGGSRIIARNKRQFIGSGSAILYPGTQQGALQRMQEALFAALPYREAVLNGYGNGWEHLAAAEVSYLRSEMKTACEFAFESMRRARSQEQWDIVCGAYYMLVRCSVASGKLTEAEHYMADLCDCAAYARYPEFFSLPDIARAWFSFKAGSNEAIADWILDEKIAAQLSIHYMAGREKVVKAAYLLKSHMYAELLGFVDQNIPFCESTGQWLSKLKMQILKAVGYLALKDKAQAVRNLELACQWAHGNGIITPFSELGNQMRQLVNLARKHQGHQMPEAWLTLIHTKAATYAKYNTAIRKEYAEKYGQASSPANRLTPREKEILHRVCLGENNAQIAASLGVTPNTIKGALRRVYAKIDADNRSDAVRIAMSEHIFHTE